MDSWSFGQFAGVNPAVGQVKATRPKDGTLLPAVRMADDDARLHTAARTIIFDICQLMISRARDILVVS